MAKKRSFAPVPLFRLCRKIQTEALQAFSRIHCVRITTLVGCNLIGIAGYWSVSHKVLEKVKDRLGGK